MISRDEEQRGILTIHRRGLDVGDDDEKPPSVVIMISGLPDSADTWDEFAKNFESDYHVVTMAYPFMDKEKLPSNRKWGFSQDEVVKSLLNVVQEYRDVGCSRIYLIGHDWGSMTLLKFVEQYPEILTKVVLEDVGLLDPLKNSKWEILVIMCYQLFLVTLFILTRFLPGIWWYRIALRCYPWKSFGPLLKDMESPLKKMEAFPHTIYPCFQAMLLSITNPAATKIKFAKTVPQLFVYGRQKRSMFHSQFYVEKLRASDGCDCMEYSNAGHWVHISHADEMAADVKKFFET